MSNETCTGCAYLTQRSLITYYGYCAVGSATDPLTGNGQMPGLGTVRLVDYEYGRCDKYTHNEGTTA